MKDDAKEFVSMPEQVYQELVRRSRQVSADTALTVGEHRQAVSKERAERKESGLAMSMDF